jgi:ATP-dependent Clp protease ATP-binding subunit ClpA
MELERMGRCALLAWKYGIEVRDNATVARPGVMTGHLLLGVLKERDCAGGLILAKMGLDLEFVTMFTQFMLLHARRRDTPEPPSIDWGDVPHTPSAQKAMVLSLEEAQLYSDTYPIGTEHMLLGILRVPEGIGCRVLNHFDINVHTARAARDSMWELLRLAE